VELPVHLAEIRNEPYLLLTFSLACPDINASQYLFSLRNAPFPGVLTPAQRRLAAAVKTDWANLAWTGSEFSLAWPRFAPASQRILSLIAPRPQVETGFSAEHQCAFWALAG
jgi:carboxylesterase type B